jgi:hypothetical protein
MHFVSFKKIVIIILPVEGIIIRVITKLPNSEQSYKGKVKTHNYINRQNQSTTAKLWKPQCKDKEVKNVFVNVWRKNIFDIYVTEYGTALTTILPILFLYLNTVTVDIGIGI